MKLSELVNETQQATVALASGEVTLVFYAHNSPGMRAEALKAGRITKEEFDLIATPGADINSSMPIMLAARIKSWDLVGDDDEVLPVTSAFLANIKDEHFKPLWERVFGGPGDVPTDASASASG